MRVTPRPPVVRLRARRIPAKSDLFHTTTMAVTAGVTIYCTLNWWHYRSIRKKSEDIKEKNHNE